MNLYWLLATGFWLLPHFFGNSIHNIPITIRRNDFFVIDVVGQFHPLRGSVKRRGRFP